MLTYISKIKLIAKSGEIMSEYEARKGSGKALADAAKAYIEAHSAEKFSLRAVSKALFVNGSYLSRVFKANTGRTLLTYHNTVRCERAKRLLKSKAIPISQIGDEVGFASSAHFSHVFRKTVGVTPSEYRFAQQKEI